MDFLPEFKMYAYMGFRPPPCHLPYTPRLYSLPPPWMVTLPLGWSMGLSPLQTCISIKPLSPFPS